ncbi:ral guanine nucleotide dissociation stimulator-like 2 isoform X1 [Stigmatopora nigra]
MLPRHTRAGTYDLPGSESGAVPLIGYRALSADGAPRVESSSEKKTTWYCPLDASTMTTGVMVEGEEREEDGIIYTVVLKQAPSSSAYCVKAATEEKLALHLLWAFALGDPSYVAVFLATYRSFTTTQRVLDVLSDRLERPPGDEEGRDRRESFDRATCSVFGAWLSEYPEDFRALKEPSRLLRLAPLLPGRPASAARLRAAVLRLAEELSERALLPDAGPDGILPPPPPPPPTPTCGFQAGALLAFPSEAVAEQLTRIETDLFVRLVPYHCLGSQWSQRDKKGREGACGSVRATVRQFNRLANAVLASCLMGGLTLNPARLLEKWIAVAQACRERKNFSSLYAIVSALQSKPIHRLRKTWQDTDKEAVRKYEELRDIFSERDNYAHSRELLKEEGTSKYANPERQRKHAAEGAPRGTVPYLGLFLTDLTMLDAAVKDRLENGYVNFDKRRREFEVLAQIRLLQSSCKNCISVPEPTFSLWYRSVPLLSQEQSDALSDEIQAPGEAAAATPMVVVTQCSDVPVAGGGDASSPVNSLISKLTKVTLTKRKLVLGQKARPVPNGLRLFPAHAITVGVVLGRGRVAPAGAVVAGAAVPQRRPPPLRLVRRERRAGLHRRRLFGTRHACGQDPHGPARRQPLPQHSGDEQRQDGDGRALGAGEAQPGPVAGVGLRAGATVASGKRVDHPVGGQRVLRHDADQRRLPAAEERAGPAAEPRPPGHLPTKQGQGQETGRNALLTRSVVVVQIPTLKRASDGGIFASFLKKTSHLKCIDWPPLTRMEVQLAQRTRPVKEWAADHDLFCSKQKSGG